MTSRRRYGTPHASAASPAGGKHINLTRCSCYRFVQRPAPTTQDGCLACWVSAQQVVPYIRSTQRHSHTYFARSSRAPSPPVTKFQGAMSATGTSGSSAAPLSQGTGAFSLSAAPSATGARASRATPLSYGIIQATGACASGAAPLSLGTGACAPGAAPPSHAPRSSQTAAPVRRSYQQGFPTSPPPGHAVAVGLRCVMDDIEAPRSRVKLDSAFPRRRGGRSALFPLKEEPTRLTTSSPFPGRSAGMKPPLVDNLAPPTGRPLLKASTGSAGPRSPSRTPTHVLSAPSATVEQEKPDTPDEPVVTPRPPVKSIGV